MSEHAFHANLPHSSFPDLLGQDVCRGGVQRYYRVGDQLLARRGEIETGVRNRLGRHFGLERTIFLYDLTNFHFEGACEGNPKAVRGVNKQKRNDCPQVVVGVVFDEFGFEVLHRTFAGNTGDSKALPSMTEALHRASVDGYLATPDAPTVVVDGGLATKDNLAELRRLGFHYLVNDKRNRRSAWLDLFRQGVFEPVTGRKDSEQVLVRHVDMCADDLGPGVEERVVLCKSGGRRDKELAIRSNAEERFLKDLKALSKRLEARRIKTAAAAERALGKIIGRHPRVARFYETSITTGCPPGLNWHRNDQRWAEADELAGCYALRTDRRDLGGENLWRLYMTLCRAEDGFQTVKSDLGLRPGFHRIEDRVDAHVFITVLASGVAVHPLHPRTPGRRSELVYAPPHIGYPLLCHHPSASEGWDRPPASQARAARGCQWDIYHKIGIDTLRNLPTSKTTGKG